LNNWGSAGRATVQFPASTQSVVDIVSGARIPLRRAFPIGTRTTGGLNLFVAKYSSCTHRYIQLLSPVLEAALRLHMSKSGCIIVSALKVLLSPGPFSRGVQVRCSAVVNHPQIDI
jgi:hypothetical protein